MLSCRPGSDKRWEEFGSIRLTDLSSSSEILFVALKSHTALQVSPKDECVIQLYGLFEISSAFAPQNSSSNL